MIAPARVAALRAIRAVTKGRPIWLRRCTVFGRTFRTGGTARWPTRSSPVRSAGRGRWITSFSTSHSAH